MVLKEYSVVHFLPTYPFHYVSYLACRFVYPLQLFTASFDFRIVTLSTNSRILVIFKVQTQRFILACKSKALTKSENQLILESPNPNFTLGLDREKVENPKSVGWFNKATHRKRLKIYTSIVGGTVIWKMEKESINESLIQSPIHGHGLCIFSPTQIQTLSSTEWAKKNKNSDSFFLFFIFILHKRSNPNNNNTSIEI